MALRPLLSILYRWWMRFAHVLGYINSRIIFTIIWTLGFGSYALVRHAIILFRKQREPESWWEDKPYRAPTLAELEKQY